MTSAVHPVSFLILHPREINSVVTDSSETEKPKSYTLVPGISMNITTYTSFHDTNSYSNRRTGRHARERHRIIVVPSPIIMREKSVASCFPSFHVLAWFMCHHLLYHFYSFYFFEILWRMGKNKA